MSDKPTIIKWDKLHFNNYIAIPRIARDELDPFEFKLYAHYIDETRWQRPYSSGVRSTAEGAGIGKNNVGPKRKSLQEKGYLTLIEGKSPDDPDSVMLHIDIWKRNEEKYGSQEAQFEQTMAFLQAAELSPGQVAALIEFVSHFRDTGVPEQGQAVPDEGHWCTESGTDSKIIESKINPLTGAHTAGEGSPLADGSNDNPALKAYRERMGAKKAEEAQAPKKSHRKGGIIVDESVVTHPLTRFFMEKTGLKALTDEMLVVLTGAIKVKEEDGSRRSIPGGVIRQWGTEVGFSEFAQNRIAELVSAKFPIEPINILKNLANLAARPTEDKPKTLPGFWAWREKNPALCTPIELKTAMTWDEIVRHQHDFMDNWLDS